MPCLLTFGTRTTLGSRKSEYWGKFNTKVAITTSVQDPFFLRDYAIVAGAYVFRSDDKTPPEVTARVDFLDDNFTVFGWHGIGEYTMVDTLSKVNGQLIPADWSSQPFDIQRI